jgi:hypothetical protein
MSRRCKHVRRAASVRGSRRGRIDKSDGSPLREMNKHVDANRGSHAFCLIDMIVDSR